MAYQHINRLPDRYKIVFRNQKTGERIRVMITEEEYNRKDFQSYIPETYGQGLDRDWYWWSVPFIETFDTPSKDLEPGTVWEGLRKRTNSDTKQRELVQRIMWCTQAGEVHEAHPDEVVVSRRGQTIDDIVGKRQ